MTYLFVSLIYWLAWNASIISANETKLDGSVLDHETVLEGNDLIRLDCSRKGVHACFIKHSVIYGYRINMCLNTESTFIEIYLPKSKPFIVAILYRPPDKMDIVTSLDQTFKSIQYTRNQRILHSQGL